MDATRAGMSANQLNSTRQWKNFAAAEKMEYKDINKDGFMDVDFTFNAKDVAKGAVAGASMDVSSLNTFFYKFSRSKKMGTIRKEVPIFYLTASGRGSSL